MCVCVCVLLFDEGWWMGQRESGTAAPAVAAGKGQGQGQGVTAAEIVPRRRRADGVPLSCVAAPGGC